MEKIVCVSGYFDPVHVGHLEYFKKSKEIGTKLMVIAVYVTFSFNHVLW